MKNAPKLTRLVLGGGCFWCLDAVLRPLRGVHAVTAGYAGGDLPQPTYKAVCRGDSGHAEVVAVDFDAAVLPLERLLTFFFAFHDPTTRNRQGADVGTQYRSVIFYADAAQKAAAEKVIARLTAEHIFSAPIVTELAPLTEFFPAEDYHQNYFAEQPLAPYCQAVILPKIAKLRANYAEWLAA